MIQITSGTIIRAVLVLGLAYLLYYLRDLVVVLLSVVVLASSIEPGTRWFIKKGIPRIIAAIIMYGLILALLALFTYFVLPTLIKQTANLLNQLPTYIDSLQSVADEFSFASFDLRERLLSISGNGLSSLTELFSLIGGGFVQSAGFLFGGFFDLLLIIVLSFYLSVQDHGVENFIRSISTEKYESYLIDLWRRSQRKIGLWMQGQLILGLLMGVFVFLGLTIVGVKYALLLAIMAALFELIPVFGPVIAAVPAVAVAMTGSVTTGIVVAIFYFAIQQLESNVIYPLVVRKIVGVPPIVAIISLLVGWRLAGLLGVLLAVPLSTILLEFMDDLEKRKRRMPTLS